MTIIDRQAQTSAERSTHENSVRDIVGIGIGHCIHVSLHGRLFCTARQYDACQTGATVSRRIFE
ncbi:hypothetical protein [Corynebacterium aurimucosum]|uniref:hypothetical protein n=1 Tax=Corynebacterium aurimucosum TaxID=169292 RepID=UPI0039907C34